MGMEEFVHFFQVVQFVGIEHFTVFPDECLNFGGILCNNSIFIRDLTYLCPLSFLFEKPG